MIANFEAYGESVLPPLGVGNHLSKDRRVLSMKAVFDKVWDTRMAVFGFGHVHSTQEVQIARLETNMNWLIRGFWLLLVAIIVRPFIG